MKVVIIVNMNKNEDKFKSLNDALKLELDIIDMSLSYNETIELIKTACKKINITFSKSEDGRIDSAIKEKDYLDKLTTTIYDLNKSIKVEIPNARYWYDIKINDIVINLKLTKNGTDNAFNKQAIIYTITGEISSKTVMDFKYWFEYICKNGIKENRNRMSEYHYLVVNKETGDILIKSIIDIHTYKSNPSNILQINWKNEFDNIEYKVKEEKFKEKVIELMKTIQKSLKQYYNTIKDVVDANMETIFVEE